MESDAPNSNSHQESFVFEEHSDFATENYIRGKLLEELSENRRSFHDNVSELVHIQSSSNFIDLFKWRSKLAPELAQFLCSSYLDEDDFNEIDDFRFNRISPEDFYSESFIDYDAFINPEEENEEFEDYCERLTSEGNLHQIAVIENEILKRVADVKRKGFLTNLSENDQTTSDKPSFSTLATQSDAAFLTSQPKTHFKYLQAEIKWLADDVIRERTWKRNAARRIALAASKAYQERKLKAEKELREKELRIRKQCAHVARLVRDWWRQMDKIVEAKHQVRLAAKRQQAMSSHLGRVLETTEEYTKWLTEGIANQAPIHEKIKQKTKVDEKAIEPAESVVPEAEQIDTDPKTENNDPEIKEEEKESENIETVKDDDDTETMDDEYVAKEDSTDDEETMAEQEKFEEEESEDKKNELKSLEDDANLSIEALLSKYGYLDGEGAEKKDVVSSASSESSSNTDDDDEDKGIKLKDEIKEPENDKEKSFDSDNKENVESLQKDKTEVKTEQDAKSSELDSITAEAMKLQPVEDDKIENSEGVSTPFLLHGTLREYQKVGLNWLAAIYQKRLNGILADEMGLGKTIQTISLLAHLACDLGIWGPHLIIVPTSVLLNWEMEFKKWCPGFKILTYYGSLKERKEKRRGWTKTNAFHVCITSYRLSIQDSAIFKRKKWRYLILDEAQNIKNFKSQRWQTLLNLNSQRRLLLTGTPLQNSLMELWSLMHFLMPNIFQSHKEFQEWFASPLTGMIEGNNEFNDQLIQRLHRVLRPFLLRRLKADVEKQMPKKYEHIIMCRLSRRQRFLYDDYMSLRTTRETLSSGQFLSVMNILMQLRKVCNHPDLFETRPITTPFFMEKDLIEFCLPKLIAKFCYSKLVAIPSYHGSGAFSYNVDEDAVNPAGATFRLLGISKNICEMARDEPSYVMDRVTTGTSFNSNPIYVRKNNLEKVDYIDVEDYVIKDRRSLMPIKKLLKKNNKSRDINQKLLSVFLPRQEVLRLNEEMGFEEVPLKKNPSNQKVGSSAEIFEVDPAIDPHDQELPKSQLYLRMKARIQRLTLISRINERRLIDLSSLKKKTICDAFGGHFWGSDYRIGPDTCFFLTKSLNRSTINSDKNSNVQTIHRSYSDAFLTIKRCLFWTPTKYSVPFPLPLIEKASRFYETVYTNQNSEFYGGLHPINPIGNEALCSEKCSWKQDLHHLRLMVNSPADVLEEIQDVLANFAFFVPTVMSFGIKLISYSSALYREIDLQNSRIKEIMAPIVPKSSQSAASSLISSSFLVPRQLHSIDMQKFMQFPDPRLIQYDCGKLQRLRQLLSDLKRGQHRVLIFTQMSRMLDILEQFLAYYGYSYLRLDGTTKVDQRQVLMERFNRDSRIFVFILSTRSGGIGINLTGADTVIFYDSDWNPTMDAQAQDRCHRIGQTRDVHIYRLISEMTIEENILRKANQKRLLSDLAIEKGKFTTAFFKQNTIQELFAEPSGLKDVVEAELIRDETIKNQASPIKAGKFDAEALTAALEACEDEDDRIAEKRATAEMQDDLEEFDEAGAILDENTGQLIEEDPLTKFAMNRTKKKQETETPVEQVQEEEEDTSDPEKAVEKELEAFESQLTPIERYGVSYSGIDRNQNLSTELVLVDAELEENKRNWALDQMKALREKDEEKAELEEDDILYCYGVYDPAERYAELERLELELQREAMLEAEEMEFDDKTNTRAKGGRGRGASRSLAKNNTKASRSKQDSSLLEESKVADDNDDEFISDEFLSDDSTSQQQQQPKQTQKVRSKISYSTVADLDVSTYTNKSPKRAASKHANYIDDIMNNDDADPTPDIEDFFPQLSSGRGGKRTSLSVRRRKSDHEKYGGQNGNIENDYLYYGYQFKKSRSRNRATVDLDEEEAEENMTEASRGQQNDIYVKRNQRKRPLDSSTYSANYQSLKRARGGMQSSIFNSRSNLLHNQQKITYQMNTGFALKQGSQRIIPALSCGPKNKIGFLRPHPSQKPISIQHIPVRILNQNISAKLPINQVFDKKGQPVFVITRELKTSDGEVLQQKFTHPVAPIPSLAGAVDMMHKALANSRKDFPKIQKFVKVTSQNEQQSSQNISLLTSPTDNSSHTTTGNTPALPNVIHLGPNKQLTVFNMNQNKGPIAESKLLNPNSIKVISRPSHPTTVSIRPTSIIKPIVSSKPSAPGPSNFKHSGIKFIRLVNNNNKDQSANVTQKIKLIPSNNSSKNSSPMKMMLIAKPNPNNSNVNKNLSSLSQANDPKQQNSQVNGV